MEASSRESGGCGAAGECDWIGVGRRGRSDNGRDYESEHTPLLTCVTYLCNHSHSLLTVVSSKATLKSESVLSN